MGKTHRRKDVVNYLIQLREEEIENLEETHRMFQDSLNLDEDSSIEVDDLAQQSRSTDSAISTQLRITKAKAELEHFVELKPELVEGITEGNVVYTDKINLVIGMAFQQFDFNDEKYVGMSVDAPLYKVLEGKKTGDQVVFNNVEYLIEEII